MRILLTGSTGFLGRHILPMLLADGHFVIAHSYSDSLDFVHPNLVHYHSHICDIGRIEFPYPPELIIHLAAKGISKRSSDYSDLININVLGTLEVLRIAQRFNSKTIIAGSFAEYGGSANLYTHIPEDAPLLPTYPYAVSKASAYLLTKEISCSNNLDVSYLRFFSVFGDGQPPSYLWEDIRISARDQTQLRISPGDQLRDFVSVNSVLEVIRTLIQHGFSGFTTLNIGTGKALSVKNFALFWLRKWGAPDSLLQVGHFPYRNGEIMRFVPQVKPYIKEIILSSYDYSGLHS